MSLAILVALLAMLLPARPSQAQSIALSQTSGTVGSSIVVNGSSFEPGSTYQIYCANTLMRSGTVLTGGNFVDVFTVPPSTAGVVEVWVQTFTEFTTTNFTVVADVTLSQATASIGQPVTVNGTGFAANKGVTVIFDDLIIATATSDAQGSVTASFNIPETFRGSHTVKVMDASSNQDTALLNTTESISITPESGPAGTEVTVSGSGFTGSRPIVISYDGTAAATKPASVSTDSKGKFTAVFAVPAGISGAHRVEAGDGTYSTGADFSTLANAVLGTSTGYAGRDVAVSGSGFKANQSVTIAFANNPVRLVTTSATGSFSDQFKPPAMPPGTYEVKITDGTSTATEQFVLKAAAAALSATSGVPGMGVTVNGSGFSGAVTVKFDNSEVGRGNAGTDGSFAATFTVPPGTVGPHTITVGDGTITATAQFTVTMSASLNQASGHVGMSLTISGNGFNGPVTVRYDDLEVARSETGTGGSFSATFTVPASSSGNHSVTATDGLNTIKSVFLMESQAPPVPAPVSPPSGGEAETRVQFGWMPVSDVSGVNYQLQVASDASFIASSILLEKTGLAEAAYTLSEAEKLPPVKEDAPYYWRVRAMDGASNQSDWSAPVMFYTASSFSVLELPDWVKYVLLGIAGVLIGLFGFWLGRRTAYY